MNKASSTNADWFGGDLLAGMQADLSKLKARSHPREDGELRGVEVILMGTLARITGAGLNILAHSGGHMRSLRSSLICFACVFAFVGAFASSGNTQGFIRDLDQEVAEEGFRLLIALQILENTLWTNPAVKSRMIRAIRKWKKKALARLDAFPHSPSQSKIIGDAWYDLDLYRLHLEGKNSVPTPRYREDNLEKMSFDSPGGNVSCHGDISGRTRRDSDPNVRFAMKRECDAWNGAGGGGR